MRIFAMQKCKLIICIALLIVFFFPANALAVKQVTLSSSTQSVEVGKTIEIKVQIDTNGEKIGAIGFDIDFPTETLEGFTPSSAGSVLPMSGGTQSSTRYECGITGKDGFMGQGLLATLIFKGRQVGDAAINLTNFQARFGPTGALVDGFTVAPINISVLPEGQQPATPAKTSSTPTGTKIIPKSTITQAPPASSTTPKQIANPTQSSGSQSQVKGLTGTTPEDPLKPPPNEASKVIVKGFSFKNPVYYGILPTILLLILVMNLAIKLYFTEKRRHLELVHLFDNHLGALSSLESKLDLVDQKGEGGKEKIIQEFELTKNQITAEENSKLSHAKA